MKAVNEWYEAVSEFKATRVQQKSAAEAKLGLSIC